jgi:hypothetical protein
MLSLIQIASRHDYKTIQINPNPTYLKVRLLNPNLLISLNLCRFIGGAKHYQLCKDAHIGFTLMIMKNYMPITNLP